MAATRVYSTAAYFVAAIVAIVLGFIPKFGQIVDATPGGALGGITVVLYGMIGLLGAKIWMENGVDFAGRPTSSRSPPGIICRHRWPAAAEDHRQLLPVRHRPGHRHPVIVSTTCVN